MLLPFLSSTLSLLLGLSISTSNSVTYALPSGALVGSSVTLDYGTFNGVANASTGVISFRGVRYADAPTGKNRWRAPVSPPTRHLGKVNASKFAVACIRTQQTTVKTETSEDCLFGNVYIPIDTTVDSQLPVLVWFHGGGFQEGNSHTAPPELILQSSASPLIFVSFEYRLGQFGFLGGTQISSDGNLNAGLLDQRAALQWVQRYIPLFGGDPTKVTIWGQSAGAGSTMFQLMAGGGNTQGLFRAAMGDSPSLSFVPQFNETYDEEIYTQFATFAGCTHNATSLSCLRSKSSTTLAKAGSKLLAARPSTLFVFAPILDDVLFTKRPVEAFTSGTFARVPMLYGSNTNEGSHWSSELPDPNANTSMPNATQQTVFNFLQGQYASFEMDSFEQALDLYPLEDYNGSFSLQGQQMYGEARYICTAGMIAGAMSTFGNAYRYHYDNPHLGSDHSDELDAFFNPPADADANDLALFQTMREYLTSFVTDGVPVSSSGPAWELTADENGSPRMLLQPGNIGMETIPDDVAARCSFWHSLSGEMQT